MSEKKYDLVITSVNPNAELALLSQKLGKALRKNPQLIEFSLNEIASLSDSDFSIIEGTTENKAKQLQAYLAKQGLTSELRSEISLELMTDDTLKYICPACDHTQEKKHQNNDTCDKCGVIGKKYAGIKRRKDILESERRRHNAVQQLGIDQRRKAREAKEEDQLRENARRQLGIHNNKSTPMLAVGLIILIGVGSITAYFYQDTLFTAGAGAGAVDEAGEQVMASNSASKPQSPMLIIPPSGGKLTLNMPAPTTALGNAEIAQKTVITTENSPKLTDSTSQDIALQIHQQTTDKDLAVEAKTKAVLVAHSIDNPNIRKAVLEVTGGEEVSIEQVFIDDLSTVEQEESSDLFLDELLMIADAQLAQGKYSQAIDISKNAKNKYQEAVILYTVIKSEIKEQPERNDANKHISQLAKLIWNESDPIKQVRIQGLLSTAYSLAGEKKVASLNLVMAIEKLRFVNSHKEKVDLLFELSNGQRSIGNISQAREILILVEDKINNVNVAEKPDAYVKVVKCYAQLLDFPSAMELTEKIENPVLLQDALSTVIKIQGKYLSFSGSPV